MSKGSRVLKDEAWEQRELTSREGREGFGVDWKKGAQKGQSLIRNKGP